MGKKTERYLNTAPVILIMQPEEALKLIKQYKEQLELDELEGVCFRKDL